MTFDEAIKVLSEGIYHNGEIKDGSGCLIPSDYASSEKINEYHVASDVIIEKTNATHYSMRWSKNRGSIRIELFENEGYGACSEPATPKGKFLVKV